MKVVSAGLLYFYSYPFIPLINEYLIRRLSNFHLLVLAFTEDLSNTDILIPPLHLLVSIPLEGRTFPSCGFVASCWIRQLIIGYIQMQMHTRTYMLLYTS